MDLERKIKNLEPVEQVFDHQSEENLVHFEEDFIADADEEKSLTELSPDDEYGDNLKSNIEQTLEQSQERE
jgi:hypothetical protein